MREIKFGDLGREYRELRTEIDASVRRVLERGWFVLGPEVEAFEREFAAWLGVDDAVSCASGTEALALALMAAGVGPGDAVLTVAHTAVPTISAISMVGAVPQFVECRADTCLMDVERVESQLTGKTRAIIPVHLYGQCVEMAPLLDVATRRGIPVIEDCAQAHGALYKGRPAGTMGAFGCFSFYPSKNLGCYGDGGAVVARGAGGGAQLRMLRNYGQSQRYHHDIKGINSRLDELQAAILLAKLPRLDRWNERRRELAARYTEGLRGLPIAGPVESADGRHVYHLYVVQADRRPELQERLAKEGIQTLIHYPIPAHRQAAYQAEAAGVKLPVTDLVASRVLSLPLYPQLMNEEADAVIDAIRRFYS